MFLKLLLSKISPVGKMLLPALRNTKPPKPMVKLLKLFVTLPFKDNKKCWRAIKQGVYSSKGTGKGHASNNLIQCSFSCQARLVLRGGGSDASSNLIQLQCTSLVGEDKSELIQWFERSSHKHISPENQNKMLQIMAHHVLRSILDNILHFSLSW